MIEISIEFAEILEAGWGPEYSAGIIMSRIRSGEVEIARAHHTILVRMSRGELIPTRYELRRDQRNHVGRAAAAWARLNEILTPEERGLLR